jgi:hypothetical protein
MNKPRSYESVIRKEVQIALAGRKHRQEWEVEMFKDHKRLLLGRSLSPSRPDVCASATRRSLEHTNLPQLSMTNWAPSH